MAKLTEIQADIIAEMYRNHPDATAFETPGQKAKYAALFKKGLVHCVSGPEKWCSEPGGNAIEALLTTEGAAAAAEITGNTKKRKSVAATQNGVKGKSDTKRSSSSRRVSRKASTKSIEFTVEHASGKVDHYAYDGSRYEKNGNATTKTKLPKYIQDAFDEARAELPAPKTSSNSPA